MRGYSAVLIALSLFASGNLGVFGDSPRLPGSSRLKPSALATLDDGRLVFVAHRENGSISVVDIAERRVKSVTQVGRGLSAIVPLPDHRHLLALDEAGDRLILLEWRNETLRVKSSLAVAPGPVDLVISKNGKHGAAASKWARRVTLFSIDPASNDSADSLKGVSQRDWLFHDGRAKGLEQVFIRFGHPHDRNWNDADVADLIAFLQGL